MNKFAGMFVLLLLVINLKMVAPCLQTVPSEDGIKSACQSCPPLYDPSICQYIDGCRAVKEENVVKYNYGKCTTATLQYSPDSQFVIEGYDPFTKVVSEQAVTVAKLQCTSDSKWVGDFSIGEMEVKGILLFTTDAIECTKDSVRAVVGDTTDTALCTQAVTCLADTTYELVPSATYCSLVNFKCPAEADTLVALIDGISTPISLSDIKPGKAEFTCKTGRMSTVTDQTIAQGEVTKITCAKRNPCAGCEFENYFSMPPCAFPKAIEFIEKSDPSGCKQWRFTPTNNAAVVVKYTIEGETPTSITGAEAITAISEAVATCANDEVYLTITSRNVNRQKLSMYSLSLCLP